MYDGFYIFQALFYLNSFNIFKNNHKFPVIETITFSTRSKYRLNGIRHIKNQLLISPCFLLHVVYIIFNYKSNISQFPGCLLGISKSLERFPIFHPGKWVKLFCLFIFCYLAIHFKTIKQPGNSHSPHYNDKNEHTQTKPDGIS